MSEEHTKDGPCSEVAAYALGGLGEDDCARFEAHLAGCDECRVAAAEMAEVASLLRTAPRPAHAPPELEARTLEAVRREAELVSPPLPSRRARRPLLRRLGLAGAAVLAIGVAFAAGSLTGGHEHGRDTGPVAHNHDHGGRNGDKLPIQLAAADGAYPRGHAELRATRQGGTVTFHSDHLKGLPRGQHYELWLIAPGGRRIPGGRFQPDSKGTTYVDLPVSVDPDAYGVVAITRERDDGNPAPTLPDVVRSDWSGRCASERPGGPQPGCR